MAGVQRQVLAVSPFVLLAAGIAFADRVPTLFWLLVISGFGLFVALILIVRCPKCGKSAYLREPKEPLWGIHRRYSAPTFETICSRCGERLS
jgi:rRNA maturation protein Nop10